MKAIYNKEGIPLAMFGTKYFAATKGTPAQTKPAVVKQTDVIEDKVTVNNTEFVAWGASNDFPVTANATIGALGVLNTGLKFIRNFTLGQGIFPCRVTGYDEQGNEQLEVVNDTELVNFCNSRMVRRYLEKLTRDYLKFGIGFVQLMLNEEKTAMVGINTINAMHCRLSLAKKGKIEKVVVSGKWPDTPGEEEFEILDMLDEYDPMLDLDIKKLTNSISKASYVFAVRDAWSNAEYYSEPAWLSAHKAGWTEIAKVVPIFLRKAYENQITWKWHVQIPYAFWDKKFPKQDYASVSARQLAIDEYMDKIEENLSSPDNANKSLFTFFEINPQNGKAEEQWVITPFDNKSKNGADNLITSAAANSEILFSLMLNPNVLGAGMPGGTYAGNQGGSNIREAFLVNIANAWIDRQNLLDPLETYLQFNGVTDVQLRFRSTILTTLDTGAGTTKKLS
jgi:hypothetical protein